MSYSLTVAVARFEDIVARGLQALIDEDPNVRMVASGVPHDELELMLAMHTPVAILNFGLLATATELRDLHRAYPATRLLVLANRPTIAERRQMLAFGATACPAKSTEARDVLHAIHLASRRVGMRRRRRRWTHARPWVRSCSRRARPRS